MTDIVAPQKVVKGQTRPNATLFRRQEGDFLFAATYAMDLISGSAIVMTTTNTRTGHGVVSYSSVDTWNQLVDDPLMIRTFLEPLQIDVRRLDALCNSNPHTCADPGEINAD